MKAKKVCFVSVDVEDDRSHPLKPLHQRTWEGVKNLEKILDKMICLLKAKDYEFMSGRDIAQKFSKVQN